jgi:hypothetical protein
MLLPLDELLESSQSSFYAFDANHFDKESLITPSLFKIKDAENHGILEFVCSSWDASDERLREGYSKGCLPVLNFPHLTKGKFFPLPQILVHISKVLSEITDTAFSFGFSTIIKGDKPSLFVHSVEIITDTNDYSIPQKAKKFIESSSHSAGNGIYKNLCDILYVKIESWDNTKTEEIAHEIRTFNKLYKKNKAQNENQAGYLLIGFGRWGTRDRFLGIPVKFQDIDGAEIIVESYINGFNPDPSLGSHFISDLIKNHKGFITVSQKDSDYIDRHFINGIKRIYEGKFTACVRTQKPFNVVIDQGNKRAVAYFDE